MVGNTYKDLSLILSEKQRVIERLKEEKNRLLQVISHDIKSPFNQLFALVQLFEMEGEHLGERQQEYIEKMYFSVISGIEMIQNLQDYRALDEEKFQARPERYDIRVLIRKMVSRFGIQSRLLKVKIRFREKKAPVFIRTDEILFLKVFEKILSNALKYSPEGTTVNVSIEKDKKGVWVHTEDRGPGLTSQELPYIYEPFRSLSAKPATGGGTTGLGMYIAAKISQMLGMEIQIRKIRRGGLKVSMLIP